MTHLDKQHGPPYLQSTKAWVPEYSGNDASWRVYRSAWVYAKRRKAQQ